MKPTTAVLLLITTGLIAHSTAQSPHTGAFAGLPAAAVSEIETDVIIQPPAGDPANSAELKLELAVPTQGYLMSLTKDGSNRHFVTQHLVGLNDGQWKWSAQFTHPYYGSQPRTILTLDANTNTLKLYDLPDSSNGYAASPKLTITPSGLVIPHSYSGYGNVVTLSGSGISLGYGGTFNLASNGALNLNGAPLNMGSGTLSSSGPISTSSLSVSSSATVSGTLTGTAIVASQNLRVGGGTTSNTGALASGAGTSVASNNSAAMGNYVSATQQGQVVVGAYNDTRTNDNGVDHTNAAFVVGVGTGPGATERRNALRVRPDGTLLINESGDISMGSFTSGEKP